MSLAQGGENQQWQETEDGRFMPARLAASRYDAAAEMAETVQVAVLDLQTARTLDVLA
jgi:hypothetical protein